MKYFYRRRIEDGLMLLKDVSDLWREPTREMLYQDLKDGKITEEQYDKYVS